MSNNRSNNDTTNSKNKQVNNNAPENIVLAAFDKKGFKTKKYSKNHRGQCPAHKGQDLNLVISTDTNGKVLFDCKSHKCSFEDIMKALGLPEEAAFPDGSSDYTPPKVEVSQKEYFYPDAEGRKAFRKTRTNYDDGTKKDLWAHWHGAQFVWGLLGKTPPLYNLPQTITAVTAGKVIYITEGEKCSDALISLGYVATTSGGGANNEKWIAPSLLEVLRGSKVVIFPDKDEVGEKYVRTFARNLRGIASSVRVVPQWPAGKPKGYDIADFIEEGNTKQDVETLIAASTEWNEAAPDDTAALLQDVKTFIHRFMFQTPEAEVLEALWVLHTYAMEATNTTPYLTVTSVVPGSAKTQILEVMSCLVKNPLGPIGSFTPSVLFSCIEKWHPTCLFDEMDKGVYKKQPTAGDIEIQSLINAGNKRSGIAMRMIEHGADIKTFSVFAPKMLAGIGHPIDTIFDRSFIIPLLKKTSDEIVEDLYLEDDHFPEAAPLRERLEEWSGLSIEKLIAGKRPDMPKELQNRAKAIARPLIAIADLAGKEWAELGREAVLALTSGNETENKGWKIKLAADIRKVKNQQEGEQRDRIRKETLLTSVLELEGSRWKTFNKGQGLDEGTLSDYLKEFGIKKSKKLHFGKGKITPQGQGYYWEWFKDMWRILPPEVIEVEEEEPEDTDIPETEVPPVTTVPPVTVPTQPQGDINTQTPVTTVTVETPTQPLPVAPVLPVEPSKPPQYLSNWEKMIAKGDLGSMADILAREK